jgi:hypothetical protein
MAPLRRFWAGADVSGIGSAELERYWAELHKLRGAAVGGDRAIRRIMEKNSVALGSIDAALVGYPRGPRRRALCSLGSPTA